MQKLNLTQLRNDVKIHLNKQVKITNLELTNRINLIDFLTESLISEKWYLSLHLHSKMTIDFNSKLKLNFNH